MSNPFRRKIQAALADANLQAALDANAKRRMEARQIAYASLPEPWEVLRQRAHRLRKQVITDLDQYLASFTARVQANGIHLHWAQGASDATQLVLEIAEQKRARLIAKSKTMVSEEIGLNHALQSRGIQVVETDLGEYIVQLRGERPSHIITPAVHLQREQVGQTFHRELGVPETTDVLVLTAIARKVLRQVFLDADIGLSGVNFGVADTGTLCIVTNEGNGRMVTTLPKTHIALMGIERVVPTLEDLALMLYLLPRSATGQKLTVYTTLIHGPRSPMDADGPEERHLILVDNGRQAMRSSPLAEALLCIRCGACLNACPVFQEIGGHAYVNHQGESSTYPGPIGSVVSPGLFGQGEFGHLARASSLCGACREACPVDINLPQLLLRVRAGQVPESEQISLEKESAPNTPKSIALGMSIYTWFATNPLRFAWLQKSAGRIAQILPEWIRLPNFTGWGKSKDFPRPAHKPFRSRWSARVSAKSNSRMLAQGQETIPIAPEPSHALDNLNSYDQIDLVAKFKEELTNLGGEFTLCTPEELVSRLISWLQAHHITALTAWSEEHFPVGLLQRLRAAQIEIFSHPDPSIRVGLTGALAGIAETGSLLLVSGSGRALSHSLLPEIHLAILHARDIQASLPEVLNKPDITESQSALLISGPSRTADIEMTLTIGVHGPGVLHVFCLEEVPETAG